MTTEDAKILRSHADAAIEHMVREHALAVNNLTEKQIVELLEQLFASGDIIRHTVVRGGEDAQCVIYIPFAREQELSGKIEAVKGICNKQHHHKIWDGRAGVNEPLPCHCLQCQLKREILDIL